MVTLQQIVLLSTLVIAVPTIILAAYMTRVYLRNRRPSHLFWSAGMWVFTVSVLLETVFSLNIYSSALIDSYLFLVVILVEMLALGSLQLIGNQLYKKLYYAFTIVITIVTAYSIFSTPQGNLILNYVVAGNPSLFAIVASSIATFAAAIVILVIAGISYRKTHSKKMLSIMIGVIEVSIAGTAYIAAYPYFLYFAEFVGIMLLWIGFV